MNDSMPSQSDRSTEPRRDGPQAGTNQRQHVRVPIQVEVDFVSESNFYQGFSENISEGGVFVSTYEVRPVGATVLLHFRLPDTADVMECEGVVCWIREYNVDTPDVSPGFGVRFSNLAPSVQLEIEAFVREREPLFYDE